MSKRNRKQPLTLRQRKLIKARARGEPLADAAIEAGYRCKDRSSAESTARTTFRRLAGRPEMRQALAGRGLGLEWVAQALVELAEAPIVTEIRDGDGKLLRVIIRHDWRWKVWVIRIVMEAFDAFGPGEEAGPFDDLSDAELQAALTGLEGGDAAKATGQRSGPEGLVTVSVFMGAAGHGPAGLPG